MAEIRRFFFLRHFRSETSFHITRAHKGRLRQSGRGLAFWFWPDSTSIAQIPMDDRDMPFHFTGRSKDFQDVTVQGVIAWRVADPEALGRRVDFSINLKSGLYLREPLDQISGLLTGLARQQALQYLAEQNVEGLLQNGLAPLQARIEEGLNDAAALAEMGVELLAVRIADLAPSAELDRAMQTPTFEALQQKADQATFQRRALAVEKERAIAENELQNRIELARRESQLIEQEDENSRNKARAKAEAQLIQATGDAERIRKVETARVEAEEARTEIYRDLPRHVLMGLAARTFAEKLKTIEHLNITPDFLGGLLGDLMQAGTKRLQARPNEEAQ